MSFSTISVNYGKVLNDKQPSFFWKISGKSENNQEFSEFKEFKEFKEVLRLRFSALARYS